jgi:hypothetical protein
MPNGSLNRVYWDLRGEPTRQIRLRTSPRYAPEITVGPDEWRAAPNAGQVSILMPPGTYTVRLTVGSETQTQQLVVRKDPNSGASEDEIRQQVAALAGVRDNVNQVADMINEIELIRAQLVQLRRTLDGDAATADIRLAADDRPRSVQSTVESARSPRNHSPTNSGELDAVMQPLSSGGG